MSKSNDAPPLPFFIVVFLLLTVVSGAITCGDFYEISQMRLKPGSSKALLDHRLKIAPVFLYAFYGCGGIFVLLLLIDWIKIRWQVLSSPPLTAAESAELERLRPFPAALEQVRREKAAVEQQCKTKDTREAALQKLIHQKEADVKAKAGEAEREKAAREKAEAVLVELSEYKDALLEELRGLLAALDQEGVSLPIDDAMTDLQKLRIARHAAALLRPNGNGRHKRDPLADLERQYREALARIESLDCDETTKIAHRQRLQQDYEAARKGVTA